MSSVGSLLRCTNEDCDRSFINLEQLESHESMHSNSNIHNEVLSPVKKYTCTYKGCDSTFMQLKRLKTHERLHSNERPYICSYDDCNKSYTKIQHLKKHKEVHGEGFTCTEPNCERIFKYKDSLKKHFDNVHLKKKPKKYKCSYCDEQFNKQSWLKRHETRHTGIYSHVCPHEECGKRFLLPSKLKRHLKIHEGYTCNEPNCKEKFPKWSMYRKHVQVAHHPVYVCPFCEKKFSTLFFLKSHSEIHGLCRTVYPCTEPNCSRFYTMERNLNHHIKSYHEKRPFLCSGEMCYKAFKTEDEMKQHYLRHHDPNGRPYRKKKKRKPKPSFAAKLAGCVKKTIKLQEIDDRNENSMEMSSSEVCQKPLEEENQHTIQTSETVSVKHNVKECQNATEEVNLNMSIETSKQVSPNQNVDEDIQELINMINERDAIKTTNVVAKFVSFKEFIKL